MSDTPVPPPDADAAERRAAELLALLATREPHVGDQFTAELVTRARAQRAIAVPLRAAGWFLAAVAGALYAALATKPREQR
jgi:hypothetical protein